MRITILKTINGPTREYLAGQTYDIPTETATLLVTGGLATIAEPGPVLKAQATTPRVNRGCGRCSKRKGGK